MSRRKPAVPITLRSQLLSLLTEACELEHGLACTYLYAAFTLKQDLGEGGLDWRQLQKVRFWAAQLYFIAAQEMLHLAQVWNLQAAVGGTPYYLRPNFPQPSTYYSLDLPLRLQPFSLTTLDRFIQFERPKDVPVTPEGPLALVAPTPPFDTVGQLYELIEQGFTTIPDVILGDPNHQVGQEQIDFPDLIRVASVADALAAIGLITAQGEGIDRAHRDCHFEIFRTIRREYLTELAEAENRAAAQDSATGPVIADFQPVRPAISDPIAADDRGPSPAGANPITDVDTADVAACFDSIYGHMLRMLQFVFDTATDDTPLLRGFGHGAIEAMTAVLKPLGEALTVMPAGPGYENQTAGPGFRLTRHIALPTDAAAAGVVNAERFVDLSDVLSALAARHDGIWQLRTAADNLERLARRFDVPLRPK